MLGKTNVFTPFLPTSTSFLKVSKTLSHSGNKFKSLLSRDNMSIYKAFVNTRKNNLYRVNGCVSKAVTNASK